MTTAHRCDWQLFEEDEEPIRCDMWRDHGVLHHHAEMDRYIQWGEGTPGALRACPVHEPGGVMAHDDDVTVA